MALDQPYWRYVGGKHGRFGRHKPWWAERITDWISINPMNPISPRKPVIAFRLGPFPTRRDAEAAAAELEAKWPIS